MRSVHPRHRPFSSGCRICYLAITVKARASRCNGRLFDSCPTAPLSTRVLKATLPDTPNRFESRGPKLPPRPIKPGKASGTGKKASGQGKPGGDGDGGDGGSRPSGDRTLASLAAYTGLVGTTGIVLANIAGIDLWGGFRWASMGDLQLALEASIPLQLINAALLLPSFSPQRPPPLGDLKAYETILKEEQRRQETPQGSMGQATASGAAGAPSASAQQASQAAAATAVVTALPVGIASSPELEVSQAVAESSAAATGSGVDTAGVAGIRVERMAEAAGAASAGETEGCSNAGQSAGQPCLSDPMPAASGPPAGVLPATAWGGSSSNNSSTGGSSSEGGASSSGGGGGAEPRQGPGRDATNSNSWSGWGSALHLAQGYYVSNNPTARLTAPVEALVSVVDTAAGEMLYRGVALTWLAAWLKDRVYEAGLDEALTEQLPAAAATLPGGTAVQEAVASLGVYGTCQCAVAAATAAFVVWSVLFKSRRTAQRIDALMGMAIAAQKANKGGDKTGKAKITGNSSSSSTESGAAGGSAASGKGDDKGAPRVLISPATGETGVVEPVSTAVDVMQRAAVVQAARDATQVLIINGIFIATGGNLAASFAAALTNQLVISAMQRRGRRRMRERNMTLARELKDYNAEVQRLLKKYKSKPPKAFEATKLDAGDVQHAAASSSSIAADGNSSSHSNGTAGSAGAASDSSSSGNSSEAAQQASFAVASGATSATPSEAVDLRVGAHDRQDAGLASTVVVQEASGKGAGSAGCAGGDVSNTSKGVGDGGGAGNSRNSLHRALAMLDQLVPEPPKPAGKEQQQAKQQKP